MNSCLLAITIPTPVFVGQWVLLFALGALVFLAYRQMGVLIGLKDYGSDRDGLDLGRPAPAFEYIRRNGTGSAPTRFQPRGTWSLLMFADPGCLTCARALDALDRVRTTDGGLQVLVATHADSAAVAAVEAFEKFEGLGQVTQDVPAKLYKTHTTPFAYLISPDGLIREKGVAMDEATIRNFLKKVEPTDAGLDLTAAEEHV